MEWNPFSPHENILTIALINIHYLYNSDSNITVIDHDPLDEKQLESFYLLSIKPINHCDQSNVQSTQLP